MGGGGCVSPTDGLPGGETGGESGTMTWEETCFFAASSSGAGKGPGEETGGVVVAETAEGEAVAEGTAEGGGGPEGGEACPCGLVKAVKKAEAEAVEGGGSKLRLALAATVKADAWANKSSSLLYDTPSCANSACPALPSPSMELSPCPWLLVLAWDLLVSAWALVGVGSEMQEAPAPLVLHGAVVPMCGMRGA